MGCKWNWCMQLLVSALQWRKNDPLCPFLLPRDWNSDVMDGTPVAILDQETTLGMEAAYVKAKIIRSLGFCHRVTHHKILGLLTSRLLAIERLKYLGLT